MKLPHSNGEENARRYRHFVWVRLLDLYETVCSGRGNGRSVYGTPISKVFARRIDNPVAIADVAATDFAWRGTLKPLAR